jgi:ASC-1-like (ASCH) protein
MNYKLEIYRKPLESILSGKKKVEIRTNNSYESIRYDQLNVGDTISFQVISGPPFIGLDVIDADALTVEVLDVRHYPDALSLLNTEGMEVLSNLCETIAQGVELLNSFHEYKQMIPIHGIFAIEIRPKC